MSALTTRLDLYKPGGGSTGLILPDEVVDIDKINDNMDKIDAATGAYICTSSTRPGSPFDGQIIYETDTKQIRVYRSATTSWDAEGTARGSLTRYSVASLAALDTISTAQVGDEAAFSAAPSIGIGFEGLIATAVLGSGSTIDWRFTSTIHAATKANLDTFIAAVVAITDLTFEIGAQAFVSGTGIRYEFTSTAGAYKALNGYTEFTTSQASATNGALSSMGTLTADATLTTDTLMVSSPSAGRFRLEEPGVYEFSFFGTCAGLTTGRTFCLATTVADSRILDFTDISTGENPYFAVHSVIRTIAVDIDIDIQIFQTTSAARAVTGRLRVARVG